MTNRKRTKTLVNALCLCALLVLPAVAPAQAPLNEAEALALIKSATNPTLKLAAAEDFIARFPNSSARSNIAELITTEILTVRDGAVALALLERARAIFTAEPEREILKPAALHAHVSGEEFESAFVVASEILATDPENLQVLMQMNQAGNSERLRRELKLIDQALQYGLAAISIIEKGIKPAKISDERWAGHKADLWICYRNTASLYLKLKEPNTQEAKALSIKASALKPLEPINFVLLGMAFDFDYSKYVQGYDHMQEGPAKQEMRKKLDAMADGVIDAWARAIGLATGQPRYQNLITTFVPGLTKYYRIRNNDSAAGLQALINKYRVRLY